MSQFTSSSTSTSIKTSKESAKNIFVGISCIVGIYISFLVFGICQENLFKLKNPKTGDLFHFSNSLVFVLCVFNAIGAFIIQYLQSIFGYSNQLKLKNLPPSSAFYLIISSITYVGSMLCTNYALQHVNFPTQVLVKSAKMVLVITGGFVIFGKRYPMYEYVSVGTITAALICFNFANISTHKQYSQTAFGLILLLIALICDGMTGPCQDRLISRHKSLTSIQMMLAMNALGMIWCGLVAYYNEGLGLYDFISSTPNTEYWVSLFAIGGMVGQIFIFLSLITFGSLYTSLFTTLRKATSTVVSVYAFGHHMSLIQWGCVAIIFSTLIVHSYISHSRKMHAKRNVEITNKKNQ